MEKTLSPETTHRHTTDTGGTLWKFNGKELDEETGLYYYGARYYDPRISIWQSVDPIIKPHESPYAGITNNPINFVDPEGKSANPVYSEEGDFLGTDDEGLKGEPIIMEEEKFEQGMSKKEALKQGDYVSENKDLTSEQRDKVVEHWLGLPERPDYDGKLTLEEANEWYREGEGKPLFTDLSKIDLSGIYSKGEDYVGEEKTFSLFTVGTMEDALVYGSITLKRYPNDRVRAYADPYDFGMHNPWNPLNWPRNIETMIGGAKAGEGEPYNINIYGSKKLNTMFKWFWE